MRTVQVGIEIATRQRFETVLANDAWDDVAFSLKEQDQHLGIRTASQLNTQPTVSPVNAS